MVGLLHLLYFAGCATALHHFYVGEQNSIAIHALELNDTARNVYEMGIIPGAGASPSLALDRSKKYLFASLPQNGTLTRYSVQADYSLKDDGTASIPASCNTTNFSTLHLTTSAWASDFIFGSASTGACSIVFSTDVTGFSSLRSKEFAGDIRSLAWSPNGRHLHALDTHAANIFNFYIADELTLQYQNATDSLTNITSAEQMVTHPTGNLVYVVTKDSNQLVTIPLQEEVRTIAAPVPSVFKILPSSIDASQYTTSTLAISSSKTSLWTLSQSSSQAIITVFSLNATTGDVIGAVARAAWSGYGSGQIAPAPFGNDDMVAITNSPLGYTAFLGLDKSTVAKGKFGDVKIANDDFLEEVWMLGVQKNAAAAPKLKSFGRVDLSLDSLGEGVWVD